MMMKEKVNLLGFYELLYQIIMILIKKKMRKIKRYFNRK